MKRTLLHIALTLVMLTLLVASGLTIPAPVAADTLYENYTTGANAAADVSHYWYAQTFTPSIAHTIIKVGLKLYREGLPGTLTVNIRATDASGHPTGPDLCSGSLYVDTIPTSFATADWFDIYLVGSACLSAGTKYAIVAKAPDMGTPIVRWCDDNSGSASYIRGNGEYGGPTGTSWQTGTFDMMFKEWGPDDSSIPTLKAEITLPLDGTIMYVGQCVEVKATVECICPKIIFKTSEFSIVKPVYASAQPELSGCSENTKVTISINGNAQLASGENATIPIIGSLSGIPCNEGKRTVSWRVCCTGPGDVTITVTPYGEYGSPYYSDASIFDSLMPKVYAIPVATFCPLPNTHLIGDSVTIKQISGQRTEPIESYAKSFPYSRGRVGITYLNVTPQVAQAGQTVTISGNISNQSEESGSYTVTVKVNDQVLEVKKGTLGAHTATPLKYEIVKNEPGLYVVDINGQQAAFSVNGEATGAASAANALPIIVIVICLVALVSIAVVLIRRRQQSGYY